MMSPVLKKFIKKWFFPGFVKDNFDGKYPFGIPDLPGGYLASFGDANEDKIFYVIWRDNLGSGFFSNFTQVMSHIIVAEKMGMIPVVDYENFPTLYNVTEKINDSFNAWEYYFKQPSGYSLDEVYRSKRVFICKWENPDFYLDDRKDYQAFMDKYIHFQSQVEKRIDDYSEKFDCSKTLAVHFRGKEMNFTPKHRFAPTIDQMFVQTDLMLDEFGFEQIFFVSEEKDYYNAFLRRYGQRLIATDAFRCSKVNSYNLDPRPQHRYLLGLEILCDAELMAKCSGLLGSWTGPFFHAYRNSRNLKVARIIDNGVNVSNYLGAKYFYGLKKMLPVKFGGLPGKIVDFPL